jgi:uncharacterized damage-inducible protein DinB
MFHTIAEFEGAWKNVTGSTRKLLGAMTDESLKQAVAEDHRTLARMAWHIIGSISEMAGHTGLQLDGVKESDPIPTSAKEILHAYEKTTASLAEQVKKHWTDETLQIEDNMYGETWKRGQTLSILTIHEVHHRGQMTVLMRQAGLKIPGIFGPSKEEWVNYNMPPPAV